MNSDKDIGKPINPTTVSDNKESKENNHGGIELPNMEESLVLHDEDKLTNGSTSRQYLVKEGLTYTGDSQGRGQTGKIQEDTLVEIFNRAIVRENPDGTREILLTSGLKTWEDYAKEHNIKVEDIEKLLKENGVKEMVAVQVAGQNHTLFNVYGWTEASNLIENSNNRENLQITFGDNKDILEELENKENTSSRDDR